MKQPLCSFVHLSILTCAAACVHAGDDLPVGASQGAAPTKHAASGAASASDPRLPPDWRTSFAHSSPKISRGHGTGHWPMTVYGDAEGMDALEHLREAKSGAYLVAEHPPFAKAARDGSATDPAHMVLFIMKKRDYGWSYRVLDENGALTQDPAECAGCHDDSQNDHLFNLPDDVTPGLTRGAKPSN